jgi:drug/metabolite transporter (DMT)-like permease
MPVTGGLCFAYHEQTHSLKEQTMQQVKSLPAPTSFWRDHSTALSEIIFVVVVFVWGITFIFSKAALEVTGPFTYNTLRMLLGVVTLAILVGPEWRKVDWSYLWPVLVTGGVLFAAYTVQSYGQQSTTASKAGFLTGTNLVYVPIFSAWLLHRIPGRPAIIGVILAFIGLFLISFEGSLSNLSIARGDFWVAVSGVGWALYIIALAYYSPQLNVLIYCTLHILVAALLSGMGWLLFEPFNVPLGQSALLVGIFTTGFLVIGLGTGVQAWVSRHASPTRIALFAALEPVFAMLAGWWIGETLTARILIGGTFIVIGMLIAELGHLLKPR